MNSTTRQPMPTAVNRDLLVAAPVAIPKRVTKHTSTAASQKNPFRENKANLNKPLTFKVQYKLSKGHR